MEMHSVISNDSKKVVNCDKMKRGKLQEFMFGRKRDDMNSDIGLL